MIYKKSHNENEAIQCDSSQVSRHSVNGNNLAKKKTKPKNVKANKNFATYQIKDFAF